MLENFQLVAITENRGQIELYRIPLHQALQRALAEGWEIQLERFLEDAQEIDFDAGYKPERHELFRIENYELPEWLQNETSLTSPNLESISDNEARLHSIKGLVAFARHNGAEIILFQNFSRSHVIQPGRFLFLQDGTYETAQGPGLTLDGKLSAVYLPADNKLLFQNFRTTNTFLPLADFYKEASEQEIQDILAHTILAPEDAGALAEEANQWFRKRFAMLRDSGVLDRYSAVDIRGRSANYDVDIQLNGGRIVFPADKAAAKKLLQFLNEELFRGAITDSLYETNSKREAD